MEKKEKIKSLHQKIDALTIAIAREKSSYEFYLELANQCTDQEGKSNFLSLAGKEVEHRKALEGTLSETTEELKAIEKGE